MATDERPNRKHEDQDAAVPDEATLRSLIDQLPLTVYIDHLDGQHTNVFTSPQLEKELGYSIDEWRANPDLFGRVLHPHDRDRVLDAGYELVQSGEGARLEYRMIARDGRVRWYLDQSAVVPATARTAGLAHGFLLDITEQKELELALERERQHLRAILELSPTVIVTLDENGQVTSWNHAAEALLGHTADDALGNRLEHLVPTVRVGADPNSSVWKSDSDGSSGTFATLQRRDGSHVEVEVLRAPLHVDGETRGELVVYHDVTAVRQAEARFRRLAEELPLVTY